MSKWGCPKCGCNQAYLLRQVMISKAATFGKFDDKGKLNFVTASGPYECLKCGHEFDEPTEGKDEKEDG